MLPVIEPVYLLTGPTDNIAYLPVKIDSRIEQIEKRPRRRLDIFLSQQRTKENSFRIDVLNEKDPHYAIRFANLPTQLVYSFITADMECNNFKLTSASDFLTAVFGCLYTHLFKLTSEQQVDFVRHASHQINPSRNTRSLGSVQQWFGLLERYFNVKIWLLDVQDELLWKSNKLYSTDKTLNAIIVKQDRQWFSLLHCDDDVTDGVMTSKQFKGVLSNLSTALKPADVGIYRK